MNVQNAWVKKYDGETGMFYKNCNKGSDNEDNVQ